jgi:hydrogenase 3 maturation protease
VNRFSGEDPGASLRIRLKDARRIAVVGIGDELQPFDRLGMVAAKRIDQVHLPDVGVFFAGTVPESITGPLRRFQPDHTLFLDAADMGARPGTIAVIDPERIQASLFSTHALPLSVVMDYVELEIGTRVTLLGIQPDRTHPEKELSDEDREFLNHNLQVLSDILRKRAVL